MNVNKVELGSADLTASSAQISYMVHFLSCFSLLTVAVRQRATLQPTSTRPPPFLLSDLPHCRSYTKIVK